MQSRTFGIVAASFAMISVGTGVTVSAELADYPVFGAQSVRYVIASLLLVFGVLLVRRSIPMPRGREWLWLIGVAISGLVLFNIAVIRSVEHAEPAAVAVLIGAVPLVLLLADSIRLRRRPPPLLLIGATLVVIGAALVQGGGRSTAEGLAWALLALACEAAFTLLAVPVLGRLGAIGVSIHTTWIAALLFGLLAIGIDGTAALPVMDGGEIFAVAYLVIVVTALAFLFWYSAVDGLGPATAGLFAGLMPIAAALSGVIPGLTTVTPTVIGGSLSWASASPSAWPRGQSRLSSARLPMHTRGRLRVSRSAASGAVASHCEWCEDRKQDNEPAQRDRDGNLSRPSGY
jgi:drug/metabolite transporter (DMT)-like permease